MVENLEEVNVLDRLYEIASDSDGAVILTYSLSSSIIDDILSRLKPPKNIRIMYSIKSGTQESALQLKDMEKKCKALELFGGIDRFETFHAKIYLFCKTGQNVIYLTLIVGSFNLTLQTLRNIEVYGVYKFQVDRNFLEKNGVTHFVEIFNLEEQFNLDLKSLKQSISGRDRRVGYDALLLLLQLWYGDVLIIESDSAFESIDFFGEENIRMFVSTFGNNSLLARLKDLLRSAFIYANEVGGEVELTIVTPFHTKEALERLFLLKDQVLESIGLKGKIGFSLRLLTNSFNVSGEVDRSSFSDPMFLRELMFESERSPEFKVKFWGYTPGNEGFIHAKVYVIRVCEKKVVLLTSANLTICGLGFELQKNLEVGIIENHPEYTEKVCRWVDECWDAEYTIESKDDKIWSELQNWYNTLEEEEKVEEDFEIEGLTDFYIYEKNVLKIRDKKNREIESMKLMLSFAKKEKPVKNLEELFRKRGDWFFIEFELKEEHLGPVFCDIIARLTNGTYIFVARKKINVVEKFPQIKMCLLPEISVPKDFLKGLIPVEVQVQIGKGISKIDLTKVSFKLQVGRRQITPQIFLIKERIKKNRLLQFLLWIDTFEATDDIDLDLFYKNEKKATCKIPRAFLKNIFESIADKKIVSFLKRRFVRLLTDERTLCPKIKSELELSFDSSIFELLGVNRIIVIRNFRYSELVGMKEVRRQVVEEVRLSRRIKLDNNIPSYPPTNVETWIYGVKKGEFTWWIPLGKLNYRLFRNPPELEVKVKPRIKTNLTPIEVEFNLKGKEIFRDRAIFDCEIGGWKNTFSTQGGEIICGLPENLNLEKMNEGINLKYRFIFKYNTADIVGKIRIKYDFFISTPHPSDPTKTMLLIRDLKEPCKLLENIAKELHEKRILFLTVIPTKTTIFKEFQIRLADKNFEE